MYCVTCILTFSISGCKQKISDAKTSFYYWKTTLQLDQKQSVLLKDAAQNRLYLRFFDLVWNEQLKEVIPNAIIDIRQDIKELSITPVIYITNKAFEHTTVVNADTLAFKVNKLVQEIAKHNKFSYQTIQIDCDWTVSTRASYFAFLKAFKKYNKKPLEATIRLHQIKYPDLTGVPPVDKGLLMFYNMGKISADPDAPNSIYNAADAEKYIATMPGYILPLDIALPVFSWSIQIRAGKVIQIYGKLTRKELSDTSKFERLKNENVYQARQSFYFEGIYIKARDLFKLEEMSSETLNQAAKQAARQLAPLEKRNIIYYELSTINLSASETKDFQEVSAHF